MHKRIMILAAALLMPLPACVGDDASTTSGLSGGENTTSGGTGSTTGGSEPIVTETTAPSETGTTGAEVPHCAHLLEVMARPASAKAVDRWIIIYTDGCEIGDDLFAVEIEGNGMGAISTPLGPMVDAECIGVGSAAVLDGLPYVVDAQLGWDFDWSSAAVRLTYDGMIVDEVALPEEPSPDASPLPQLPARRTIGGVWKWMLGATLDTCAWAP